MRLIDRLTTLEKISNTAPMLTMDVHTLPTAEQQAKIGQCIRTGRRLAVFFNPGDTLWLAGYGVPPWEERAELDHARGLAAEIDSPEENARF